MEKGSTKTPLSGEEAFVTTHRILECCDPSPRVVDILASDIFDSRQAVALSALSTLGRIKQLSAIPHISRLFTHRDEKIQCAAVKAVGDIGHPGSMKVLIDLFKVSQGEQLRLEVLRSLMKICPREAELLTLLRAYSSSPAVSPESRACALGLLLEVDEQMNPEALLSELPCASLGEVFRIAEERQKVRERLLKFPPSFVRKLNAQSKVSYISLFSLGSTSVSLVLLLDFLQNGTLEERTACYRVIGRDEGQRAKFDQIVEHLSRKVESAISIEEEAQGAITQMEECLVKSGGRLGSQVKDRVSSQISLLFNQLKSSGSRGVSEDHELGWIIVRSKEYLEYYGDEQLKHGIVHYLKGSDNYRKEELLQLLKNTAVKVEVRHFEGYNALIEVINNPKRSGIALIARELAIAKLGKRDTMYHLIRNLRLSRLLYIPTLGPLFFEIYRWAKEAKLYRLSEAALFALAKVDGKKTAESCIECMTPPIESKILAIASIHLMRDLSWAQVEPKVAQMIGEIRESYILLNLIDALSALNISFSKELVKALLNRILFDTDKEVVARSQLLLGEKADANILDDLMRIYHQAEDWKRSPVLSIMERITARNGITSDVGLSEFLYKVLREGPGAQKARAAAFLYRIGDDYAVKVLQDIVRKASDEEKAELTRSLKGALKPDLLPVIGTLLIDESAAVQQALRETLLESDDVEVKQRIVELALASRDRGIEGEYATLAASGADGGPGGRAPAGSDSNAGLSVDLSHEKKTFQFEREHVQTLAVFFTDIKGYSHKAQLLSSLELATLIQEYEGILLPIVSTHKGELIKRMGDGHLFVFEAPLNSVLAGIRIQKALKRFNSFREEKYRIQIRVGIHLGEVARKEGDVFGNTVNIASRLESSAKEGTVYISRDLNELTKRFIHTREVGLIQVKNFQEPILVYEPYEISIDLPKELDPSKREGIGVSGERGASIHGETPKNDAAGMGPAAASSGQAAADASASPAAAGAGTSVLEADGMGGRGARVPEIGGTGARGARQASDFDLDLKLVLYVKHTFRALNDLALKVEKGEEGPAAIRWELARRWKVLRKAFRRAA
jgi:class 3 adenylate cyclase/predicted transcriptional regulator